MEGSSKSGEMAPRDQYQLAAAAKELREKTINYLFDCAMKRDWDEVVSTYKKHPEVHRAKLIRSGDTALHIAVSFGEERVVEQLVELISQGGELKRVLQSISTEANKVLEKTTTPRLKESLESISAKANQASEKFPELGGINAEAVQIISDLKAIAGREFSDQLEDGAKEALEIISSKARQAKEITGETKKSLEIKNNRGNTALHIAAERGSARMCHCIAQIYREGLGVQNNDHETPFVVAALNGKKDAFLCLHSHCPEDKAFPCIRGKDGETILHCAINGDYFDLAFQIIYLYPELAACKTENGLSPLHVLASKPSAFKSGSHLRWSSKIMYFCTLVDKLKEETSVEWKTDEENNFKCPENYQVCADFFQLFCSLIRILLGKAGRDGGGSKNLVRKMIGNTVNFFMKAKNKFSLSICKDKSKGKQSAQPNNKTDLENQDNREGKASRDGRSEKISLPIRKRERTEKQTAQPNEQTDLENPAEQRHEIFPANYQICVETIKLLFKAMLVILGLGSRKMRKVRDKKQKHTWSDQVMGQLLQHSQFYRYEDDGQKPQSGAATGILSAEELESGHPKDDEIRKQTSTSTTSKDGTAAEGTQKKVQLFPAEVRGTISDGKINLDIVEKKAAEETPTRETPILIAAKNGITEMVERILELFPVALHDTNSDEKNIVLLAVENRQPRVYQLLMKEKKMKEVIFHRVDRDGNSALHLAARLGDYRPWRIPGAALQMQWELKWFKFVKDSLPLHFFPRHNKKGQTPREIFTETHNELVKSGGEWLTSTSQSCSVVAALIATVAFATSSTVPGGVKQDIGTPTLENKPPFDIFAISSLVALCFSVTSLVMFLAILTSRRQEKDFGRSLPRRILVGLTTLFVSIGAMLISFCAGHFFVLKDTLKYVAFPVYAVTCLPVTFFAIAQFPLYIDFIWATFESVPQRGYKPVTP